jgi:hypothetical protein
MDYLLPTSMECPSPELGETVTPPPRHPVGAKGIGESATVGSPATVVNSIVDARPVRGRARGHAANPATIWRAIQGRPIRPDLTHLIRRLVRGRSARGQVISGRDEPGAAR